MEANAKFDNITDSELVAEIARRRQIRQENAMKQRRDRNRALADALRHSHSMLDYLAPEHAVKSGCSDNNTLNTENCTRCILQVLADSEDASHNDIVDGYNIDVEVTCTQSEIVAMFP